MICYHDGGDEWWPVFSLSLTKENYGYAEEIDLPEEVVAMILKAQEDFNKAQELLREKIREAARS